MKVSKKKAPAVKKAILDELAGSGLEHGPEVIKDALEIAFREGEEDREDVDIG